MLAISLLIFDEVVPSSITGVIDLLSGANLYLAGIGRPPAFHLELVGEKDNPPPGFPLIGYRTYADAASPHLIIIPSFRVGNVSLLSDNAAGIEWITQERKKGTELASLCVGSYFLAEAGLLDGKEVTSHWAVAGDMQRRYPAIKMRSDQVITDQDGIYTSGGAFSSLKLILYLIEKFCGREAAIWISKMYAIEMDRTSQAHFAVFTGQHQHEDKEILRAQQYIEQHYPDPISMDDISRLVNMGQRNFIRRFKAATNNTPFEYLQRVRIESAKRALENNDKDVISIMDDAGYRDQKAFRSIFRRLTGLSLQEYKKKYARKLPQ
ncbi:MAG TPA: helix-turn-helix domain-containing protein [Puia sp.]|jgi:transcriptional regulator GlxA family with amidase domain